MKLKWKCLLYKIGIPIIIAIGTIVLLTFLIQYYVSTLPDVPLSETQLYQSEYPITYIPGMFEVINPMPIVLILGLIGGILIWFKLSAQSCIIKENTITDSVANGIFTILGLINILICVLIFAIAFIIIMASFIISLWLLIPAAIIMGIAYSLYTFNSI